jgi:hypothetical protein
MDGQLRLLELEYISAGFTVEQVFQGVVAHGGILVMRGKYCAGTLINARITDSSLTISA